MTYSPYDRGYQDRLDHFWLSPYPPGSEDTYTWLKGWCHADMESLDGWAWNELEKDTA